MLNRTSKKYSRVICLGGIVAFLALGQFCSGSSINPNNTNNNVNYQQFVIWLNQVRNNEILRRKKDEVDYKKFVLQVSWKAHASLFVNDPSRKEWFNDEMYSESIYKTISDEIADCMTLNEEYKNAVYNGTEIVEYATKPKDLANGYSQENWNAVVLRNYLAGAIYGHKNWDKYGIEDSCVEEAGKSIKDFYKHIDGIEDFINKAVADIKEYAKALDLYSYIKKLKQLPNECGDWQDKQAPNTNVQQAYGFINKTSEFCVREAYVIDNGKRFKTPINLILRGREVVKVLTNRGSYAGIGDNMTLCKRMTGEEGLVHNIDSEDLLKRTNLHNLINYGNTILSSGKCFFNSTMQALNAAAPFRTAVTQLAIMDPIPWQQYNWQGSCVLGEFTSGIKLGTMSKNTVDTQTNNENINRYENAVARLATALENTTIFRTERDYTIHHREDMQPNLIQDEINNAKQKINTHMLRKKGPNKAAIICEDIIRLLNTELEARGMNEINFWRRIETGIKDSINPIKRNNPVWTSYATRQISEDKTDVLDFINTELAVAKENTLTILPELLVLIVKGGYKGIHDNEPCEIYYKEEMNLKDTEGNKKYKLVSTVDKRWQMYHFVATIRTNQGWVVMDDMNQNSPIDETEYWNNNGPRRPCILVYQRCK